MFRKWVVGSALMLLAHSAWSYSSSYTPYMDVGWTVVSNNTMSHLSKSLYGDQQRVEPSTTPQSRVTVQSTNTVFVPAQVSVRVPEKLSAAYPLEHRVKAQRVFEELLVGYRSIENRFGIPRNDVAGAVAAFVAGSYMALHNADFPDEHFQPLVRQMRTIIAGNPAFARTSNSERQEMYEQMAILGMFLAANQMGLKESPNPRLASDMRLAAKGYLEQFLNTDPDRIQLTAKGMVLR